MFPEISLCDKQYAGIVPSATSLVSCRWAQY